ncbi:MAG: TMEM43 family protein [Dokdonella sp.]
MARARRKKRSPSMLVVALVLVAIAAAAWFVLQRYPHVLRLDSTPVATTTAAISSERVDPANDGHRISISGNLKVARPVRDPQLGINADAVALLRTVEMLQWRECGAPAGCDYELQWSQQPVDSSGFKKGHENPAHLPFLSARFLADDIRLGAFKVDVALATVVTESTALAVHVAQLPPNLAATFRDHEGALYAGADPDHGAVGDLRVSYRVVPAGQVHFTAIQEGDHLKSPPVH